jgi:hypothetical protein
MTRDDMFLEAVRAVRSELPELVGDGWREVDQELADTVAMDNVSEDSLVEVMNGKPEVQNWVVDFLVRYRNLDEPSPFEIEKLATPPGEPTTLLPPRYACPVDGAIVQYRRSPAQAIKICPQHAVKLVLSPR